MNVSEKYNEIVNSFKEEAKKAVDDAMSEIHCELMPYIESDTHSNVERISQRVVEALIAGKFEHDGEHFIVKGAFEDVECRIRISTNQYDSVRKSLIDVMPKCPKDLEIESLKERIKLLESERF